MTQAQNTIPNPAAVAADRPSQATIQVLLDRLRGAGMVASCYVDASVIDGFGRAWPTRVDEEARRVRARLAGDPARAAEFERHIEAIRRALEVPPSGRARGMAVFSADGGRSVMALGSAEPFEDRLVVDEEAYLVPLLEAERRRGEFLVVVTDSWHGRLFAAGAGESRCLCEVEDPIRTEERDSGQRHGKWDATLARRRDEHDRRHLGELAERVARAWDACDYRGLVLMGEHETLEQLRGRLPDQLAARVVREAPRPATDEPAGIDREVRAATESVVAAERGRLLAELAGRLKEGFAVAAGPREVIEALRDGQARALVLAPDRGEVGARCAGCGSLFVGEPRPCPYCGEPCAKTNLWQGILTLALRHGVAAHVVADATPAALPSGVAALLARDEPPWAREGAPAAQPDLP